MRPLHHLLLGLGSAAVITALDQISKYWLLSVVDIAQRPPIEITPFFNLVMVWNYGISFGMLAEHRQPVLLIILSLAIISVLIVWLYKSDSRYLSLALGSVIGGAFGNIIDRIRFNAVADFFDFHIAGYHWPAFNIADSAIFIGVVLLCAHSMFTSQTSTKGSAS